MNKQQSWKTIPINSLVIARKGKRPLKLSSVPFINSVPYLDIEAIEGGKVSNYADPYSSILSKSTDIFIVADGSRSGLVAKGLNGSVGSTLLCLTPLGIDDSYLFYILRANYYYFNHNTKGSSIPHLDLNLFNNFQIPVPPLEVQRSIAQELKEKLRLYEEEFSNVEQELDSFALYRRSIIQEAITGKLTEEWRKANNTESIENYFLKIQTEIKNDYDERVEFSKIAGKRLPKNELNNKVSENKLAINIDLPTNWLLTRLQDICYLITDGTHQTPSYFPKGIPFLSVKNVRPFKILDDDIKYISEIEHQEISSRCSPEEGDILYTKIGATYGYAAKVKLNYEFNIFVSLALVKPVKDFIDSDFLEIILNSDFIYHQAKQKIKGVANPDLHLIEIRDFRVPLTNINEQKAIAELVHYNFREIDELESKAFEKIKQIQQIQQSLLENILTSHSSFEYELGWIDKFIEIVREKRNEIETLHKQNKKLMGSKLNSLKKNILERKTVSEILLESPNTVLPIEEVWKLSKYYFLKDIEAFYEEVEDLVSNNNQSLKVSYDFIDTEKIRVGIKLILNAD